MANDRHDTGKAHDPFWPHSDHRGRTRLTLSSHTIELDIDHGLGPTLRCPRCSGDYLHRGRVTVFDRGEDAELTSVTIVDGGLSATHLRPSDKVANPSGRRDGIAVGFDCESCKGDIELTISQHKGSTLLAWRFEPAKGEAPR